MKNLPLLQNQKIEEKKKERRKKKSTRCYGYPI
jgi:hypothetical protein